MRFLNSHNQLGKCVFIPCKLFVYKLSTHFSKLFQWPSVRRFPFDWRNPHGFLIAVVMEYVIFSYEFAIAALVIAMAIASYVYCTAFCKIIRESLISIKQRAHAKIDRPEFLKQIVEFFDVHSSAKQLSDRSGKFWYARLFLFWHICSLQIGHQIFRFISTFDNDDVCVEFDHNFRSNDDDSNNIGRVHKHKRIAHSITSNLKLSIDRLIKIHRHSIVMIYRCWYWQWLKLSIHLLECLYRAKWVNA